MKLEQLTFHDFVEECRREVDHILDRMEGLFVRVHEYIAAQLR